MPIPADHNLIDLAAREEVLLAPYAQHSVASLGRKHLEAVHSYRGPFQRDRDRIIHSAAFRKLSHKTQVYTGELDDFHRNRLTHTLEVASISRTLARALRLNEDLVEALALAHDIGHPPFGHAGEDVLDECLQRFPADDGQGFNHNQQALRICELLETRYATFPGLNLSIEVLEGQTSRANKNDPSSQSPLLESQVVDAADSIAYDTHDADDAMELGLLSLDELLEVPLWHEAADRVQRRTDELTPDHMRRAVLHELIDWQVSDLVATTTARLREADICSTSDVRKAAPLVLPTKELAEKKEELEVFLFRRVYRHERVLSKRVVAQQSLTQLFEQYMAAPDQMPSEFRCRIAESGSSRTVADFLAGMTDRFALSQFARKG